MKACLLLALLAFQVSGAVTEYGFLPGVPAFAKKAAKQAATQFSLKEHKHPKPSTEQVILISWVKHDPVPSPLDIDPPDLALHFTYFYNVNGVWANKIGNIITLSWNKFFRPPRKLVEQYYKDAISAIMEYELLHENEFRVTPDAWTLYRRSGTLPVVPTQEPVGISFEFPESPKPDPEATPPWAGYFVTQQKSIPTSAKVLVVEFEIKAGPGVTFNYKSEPGNVCDYSPPAFRVYVARGLLYGSAENNRWWYTPGQALKDTSGLVSWEVPLAPENWNNVYAHAALESPNRTQSFIDAKQYANFIGITFGGGCFYGHGLNTSNGKATFYLRRFYFK